MLAHHRYQAARDRVIGAIDNAYDRLAATDDYKRNANNLKVIQVCVVTVSAAATGIVNSIAHVSRLGWPLAILLAAAVTGFVEGFYFVLRHGLTAVYKSGKQRLYAMICYRAIQATMILNLALLCSYIVGFSVPPWLNLWNHWSIVCHFTLALIGVSLVRDSDSVVANRMLELKAETARQDLITSRRAAAIGSPVVLVFANLRGFFDSISIAFRLLFRGGGFAKSYIEQVETIAKTQYSHLDDITTPHGQPFPRSVTNFPGSSPPKGPAQRP
jgi:hypothetical protein